MTANTDTTDFALINGEEFEMTYAEFCALLARHASDGREIYGDDWNGKEAGINIEYAYPNGKPANGGGRPFRFTEYSNDVCEPSVIDVYEFKGVIR